MYKINNLAATLMQLDMNRINKINLLYKCFLKVTKYFLYQILFVKWG